MFLRGRPSLDRLGDEQDVDENEMVRGSSIMKVMRWRRLSGIPRPPPDPGADFHRLGGVQAGKGVERLPQHGRAPIGHVIDFGKARYADALGLVNQLGHARDLAASSPMRSRSVMVFTTIITCAGSDAVG